MNEPKKAQLTDMLNYKPDSYYSDDEIKLIRGTFKDNPKLLSILRKTFIPTVSDPNLPLEEFAQDSMIAGKNWSQIPESERGIMVVARQEALSFIIGGLIKLKIVANVKEESPEQANLRRAKDSTK